MLHKTSKTIIKVRTYTLAGGQSAIRARIPCSVEAPTKTVRGLQQNDSIGIAASHALRHLESDEERNRRPQRDRGAKDALDLAVGETVSLLHPPLPLVGVSMGIERGCQHNGSLADG